MPYKEAIVAAIEGLKDHNTASSVDAIRKYIQASIPPDKEWNNKLFLTNLKSMKEKGDLIQVKSQYQLSPTYKERRAEEIKEALEKEKKKKAVSPKQHVPSKEVPKKKIIEVKNKLSATKVVTIVTEGHNTEKMEVTSENESSKEKKEFPKKKHTYPRPKIITAKTATKTITKNPMETA